MNFLSVQTVRKGWITLANQGFVSATNFMTGVLIGRFCTKEEFGLYMLGFSIVLFVMDLQSSLISTPYMVYSPRLKENELRLYNGSSLIHQLALSSIVIFSLAAGGLILSFGYGPLGLAPVFWSLVLAIGFILFREFVRRLLFAGLRMEIALILDLCIAMVQIGGLFLLAGSGLLSAMSAYCAIGFACGFAGTSWLILNRSSFKIQIRQAISDLAHNWTFGKWVFASGILWAISMNLYPWFLTFFHGTASAGVWGACLGVTALANVPLAGMQNYLGPKIANVYADKGIHALRRFVFKGGALLSVVMIILSCVLLIFGEPLIELFYGQKYSGNGFVVFVLALGLVAASTAFSFSRALFAVERADIDFKVNFIPLFILFTIGLWLVYLYGPLGAAVGLLLSNAAASAARCGVFVALSRSMKWNSIGISY